MKALIIDYMSDKIDKGLEELGIEFDKEMLPSKEKLMELIPAYDMLIMRVDPFIDKDIMDKGENLKAIFVGSTGTNHIDKEYAKEKGIEIYNSPGLNANAVAELVIAKILDLYRNTIQAQNEIKVDGIWNKYRWIGRELRNKTIGIIGYGAIGRRVAEIANVFHMDVLASDPFLTEADIKEDYTKLTDLDEIFEKADVITLHVPLTPDTKDMIAKEQLEKMKDDAVIINAARGGIVNEDDLYEALQNKIIGGANFDTISNELGAGGLDSTDTHVESKLFECDRFYITPHIGGSTHDSQDDIGDVVLENIKKHFDL